MPAKKKQAGSKQAKGARRKAVAKKKTADARPTVRKAPVRKKASSPAAHAGESSALQSATGVLANEADRLSAEHGLPRERWLACLSRIAGQFSIPTTDGGELAARIDESPFSTLYDAVHAIGPEAALASLESDPLVALSRRRQTLRGLAGEFAPFYTLPELATHLREFRRFSTANAKCLVETGLSPADFATSPWLARQLGRLYDVRTARSPFPRGTPLRYDWVRFPPDAFHAKEVQSCDYAQANLLPGLDVTDAARLESERPRVLAARDDVLAKLIEACGDRNHEGLLERCLDSISAKLDRETIDFLLRMDVIYLGGNASEPQGLRITRKLSPGGLTNLIETIRHVETELRTSAFHRTKERFPAQVLLWMSASYAGPFDAGDPYWHVVGRPEKDAVDAALDLFDRLADQTRRFDVQLQRRLALWLDPDFQVEIRAAASPAFADQIATLVPLYVAHLEAKARCGEPLIATPDDDREPATTNSPGYLGLWVVKGTHDFIVHREGRLETVDLTRRKGEQHLFEAMLAAGAQGTTAKALDLGYPNEAGAARRQAKASLKRKLCVIGISIPNAKWELVADA